MANCASQPGPTRVSGQAMIPALLIRMSMPRPASRNRSAKRADAVEVGEVELVDLDAVDAGQRLPRGRGPPRGDDDLGPGAGQRAGGLQADARSSRR